MRQKHREHGTDALLNSVLMPSYHRVEAKNPDHYSYPYGPGKVVTVDDGQRNRNAPKASKRYVARTHKELNEARSTPEPNQGLSLRAPMGDMSGTFSDDIDEFQEKH